MADPFVQEQRGFFTGLVGSTAMVPGDLVYFDGTDWELADSSDNTKFAEAVNIHNVNVGETGGFCTFAILVDEDAPYTQGDQYFLSETAGETTATRPTTAASLRQVVGFGLSSRLLRLDIQMPREDPQTYNLFSNQSEAPGHQLDTSGDFIAAFVDANDEDIGATFAVPDNTVGVEFALLYSAAEAVGGATTFAVTVSGAKDGEQWDGGATDSTLTAVTVSGANADEIHRSDVTTGFDAAGVVEADNLIGFHGIYGGGQTDVVMALSLQVVWLVV